MQSEDTKKRVADAARGLFAQKGYKATSIEDIVGITGSSKGNIYYHFKSKEGLFLYLIDEWDQEWEQQWQEKESLYTTTTEKLYGVAEQMVLEERITEMIKGHLDFYQKLIQQGIDNGEFKQNNVEGLSVVFESLTMGLSQMSRKLNKKDALALYHLAITVFLHGIAKEPN